ncbi:MAG: ABC-F family ATP-binding cassette domain-containing protein [Ignavibacteriales bacterium]|nr:ABC-F family ATP-binding cassette domain-containing protein [Ignavibacteriales bacterium]MCB9209090.1 ABC-F family ATP-binding cassette domain-containing protein [Ignavibacteriales bacterium]MCB9217989.1 ABC-F family ATP-binding cassette domain-containing protein [Ignavibacteriales bacterium]MCB9260378.1 ABC-F family ATP-binding cassette domain-containing protein [Ignavibacteriales bacterium]
MIDIINLSVQFTGNSLFENVNLKIQETDKIALVGSNGAGKSTFLKILSGLQSQETGNIQFKKGIQIGYLPQELISLSDKTIFEEVRNSVKFVKEIEEEENKLNQNLLDKNLDKVTHDKIAEKLGLLHSKMEESEYYEINAKIEKILMGLGFTTNDLNRKTSELSGGWQMRVELAKILTSANDLILLDEPTNHLDIDSLQWLVKFLKAFKGAIILVSHDRYFVNRICSKTLEIYFKNVTFFKGNYNDYLQFKEERDIRLKAELRDQQKKIKQTEDFIERFRYKATKAKQVQSRVKQLEKIDRIQIADKENKIHFRFFDSIQSGVLPIKISNLSKAYDDNLVLSQINLQIERGEKVALVGPNGAGKTTLSKLISQKIKPTSGNIELGHNTFISFYAQDVVDNLNLENDIISELAQSDSENTIPQLRTILGAFLFNGDDVFKKIKVLSGGEKSRVALAKVLLTKANTIVLDEPTNHLDFDSKLIVQNALKEFKGTLIIVSHDIDFLKSIVTKVIEVRDNKLKEYYGGIEYYLAKREEESEDSPNKSILNNTDQKLTRKEQKRLEAERRQKEHSATKDLKNNISKIEKQIEEFENKKNILESDLTKEEIYSNSELVKKVKIEYDQVKNELDSKYLEWTELQEKLERINNELNIAS